MGQKDMEPEDFLRMYDDAEQMKQGLVLDVREPAEWAYYHLERSLLMPMNEIPERWEELPREEPLYIICAHGVRSRMVCHYLEQKGFQNVVNVDGGMAAVAELKGFQYD